MSQEPTLLCGDLPYRTTSGVPVGSKRPRSDRSMALMRPRNVFSIPGLALLVGSAADPLPAQWIAQPSGTNARLRGLAVVNDRVVWASGNQGTFTRTIDGGTTWSSGTVPGAADLDFRDVQSAGEQKGALALDRRGPEIADLRTPTTAATPGPCASRTATQGLPGCDGVLGRRPWDRPWATRWTDGSRS